MTTHILVELQAISFPHVLAAGASRSVISLFHAVKYTRGNIS